jgi:hypothetical protein
MLMPPKEDMSFFVPLGGEENFNNVAKVEGVCAHIQ